MIRLTDEEIEKAITGASYLVGATVGLTRHQKIVQAQLKKVVEWGNEDCYDHNGEQRKEQEWQVKRRECLYCWQALLEEINGD